MTGCDGCKSTNRDAAALQRVIGLDAAISYLMLPEEIMADYLLLPYIIFFFFFPKGFDSILCLSWKTAWKLESCMVTSQ